MKTKCLFLASICLLASHVAAALTPEQKADFLRVFKSYSHPQFEHSDERKIEVFFFDLDGDGVEEAIASNNATVDIFEYTRHVYALANGTWIPVKKIREYHNAFSPVSFFGAQSHKIFKLTEGDKPPQLVSIDGEHFAIPAIEDGFLIAKWLPVSQLFEFERDSLVKIEQLTSEIYPAPPSPKEEDEAIVMLPEKVNPETEPWINDPSAVPLPSNGLWHPERIRYIADFSNDGIPDLLLGHGHIGSQLDRDYTLYLGNAEGKYRRHAVFQGIFHPEFAIENRTDGKVLLWLLMRKNQKITLGYYVITDKGFSEFATDETFADDEEGKAEALKALNYYRLKRNWSLNKIAVISDTLLNAEISETIQGKVNWLDNKYVRSKEEPAEKEKKEENIILLTREEIIQPEPADEYTKDRNRSRIYAEVDLSGNGLKDIIISDPWHTRGSGGIGWSVYFCVNTNQYKSVGGTFGREIAVEDYEFNTPERIWSYWRIGGGRGTIQYLYFENGEPKESPGLEIFPSDGGSSISDRIYDAIFANNRLKFEQTPYDATPDNTSSVPKMESKRVPDKSDFLQVFGKDSGITPGHPTSVSAFYFDLNGDGVIEAIATVNADMRPGGNRWHVYTFINGEWVVAKEKRDNLNSVDPISVLYASSKDFYVMNGDCKESSQLVIINGEEASKVTIDEDGFLIVEKSPTPSLFKYVFMGVNLQNLERLIPEIYSNIPPLTKE